MSKQTMAVGALAALALILAVAALTMAVGNSNSVDAEHSTFNAVFERLDDEQAQINALSAREFEDVRSLIKRLDDEQEQIDALREREIEDVRALIERLDEEQDQIDALRARIEALERAGN